MSRYAVHQQNLIGRDFVVGDIHGCFSRLAQMLDGIGFDESQDRLFSVGDLVDRGPESDQCLAWLNKPWFHAVRGNHEEMIIEAYLRGGDKDLSFANGGAWIYGLPEVEAQCYAALFDDLPFAMEVVAGNLRFGLVHAECPMGDWDWFKAALEQPSDGSIASASLEAAALWARTRISHEDSSKISGVDFVVVGHTPQAAPLCLGNVIYLDTGACFGRPLSMLCLNTMSIYVEERAAA